MAAKKKKKKQAKVKQVARRKPARKKAVRKKAARRKRALSKLNRVVVKFHDNIERIPYTDGYDDKLHTGPWARLEARYGRFTVERPIKRVEPAMVQRLSNLAREADPAYRAPDFLKYFYLELSPGAAVEKMARELRSWPSVESAYVGLRTVSAQTNAARLLICSKDPEHLKAAPHGIGAATPAPFVGGRGEGQHLIDIELGWTLDHLQLRQHQVKLLGGSSIDDIERPHGTAALGVACGIGAAGKSRGIAPGVAAVGVCSCAGFQLVDALWTAREALQQGGGKGVILIEQSAWGAGDESLPVEVTELEFKTIKDFTTAGITVIEPAGNGRSTFNSETASAVDKGINLDGFKDPWGNRALGRGSRGGDSGAIMVGAAQSKLTNGLHRKYHTSNFGLRVDCYAWGDSVIAATSSIAAPFEVNTCTGDFGETSAAAAIIAGVALVVLSVAFHGQPSKVLTPLELRKILSTTGTASPQRIGVMPRLAEILANKLPTTPTPL